MTNKEVTLHWTVVTLGAAALIALGAATTYLLLNDPQATPGRAQGGTPASVHVDARPVENPPVADPVITLSEEAVKRAGIAVAPVESGSVTSALRLPGVVEANAYQQTAVTSLVAGRIAAVLAELGQQVRRGQVIARVFSAEISDARARHTAARAELEAHERELARTQKLVEIGAASRQDLERIHAEHTAQLAAVQSARSRLELLGVPAAALEAETDGPEGSTANVVAPLTGIVTERLANVGVNVDATTKLFTVADLSTVWVVGHVFEKDLARVHVGMPASVSVTAFPTLRLTGRISYLDPQVTSETRTAKLRVEVANPRAELRLGMYAEVEVAAAGEASVLTVLTSAVQTVGGRQVVYLADPARPGRYIERTVQLGASTGGRVEVLVGLQAADRVVTSGSFSVRAERERLGLPDPAQAIPTPAPRGEQQRKDQQAEVQTARVVVNEQGFQPSAVTLRAGREARLTFVRTTDKTCATEVVFPSLKIKRALRLNEPVEITFTPEKGEIGFACGMSMLKGTIVVVQ